MLKTVGGFRYIEALCPLSWKVYGNESTVQTCMDQILTLQRDARAGVSHHKCFFGCLTGMAASKHSVTTATVWMRRPPTLQRAVAGRCR